MPLKVSASFATVTGSRRRTGAPRSQRGTRLKATTDRAFLVSTGIPTPARATEKACPSLPGVRAGNSQPIHGSTIRSEFKALSRLHRATTPKHSCPRSKFERVPSLGRLEGAMTERIQEFLRNRRSEGQDTEPCLVVDLEVVRDNYQTFAKALPDSRVFYAVKANPAPEVLSLLASMGSCFDTATVAEIEMALAAGATPDRVSYGNTIKKERDIARAFALGIRLFAVDCAAEVEKIARAAPGAKVFCRILYDCAGAEWPLSRKFGCDPEMAVEVLDLAKRLGLEPCGISFHVGSQQRKVKAWDRALSMASTVFRDCAERGINLSMVNMGGGFPTKYLKDVPPVLQYGRSIFRALRKHFGNQIPETIIEPGRGMVG